MVKDTDTIDFARLRADRRRRLLEAMSAHDLDALVLGRPANVAYASGARFLWTAGVRPFGPLCVVVRESGAVHLLSTSDEGVPPEIPHENLFGLTWNPSRLAGWLARVPGLAGRIGTDGLTPAIAEMFAVVDGRAALRQARALKTPDELACVMKAIDVAKVGLAALDEALSPGITERELLAVFAERVACLGAPMLASESVACATEQDGRVRLRQMATDRAVKPGQLVVLTPGVLYAGYEGGLGRTWAVEPQAEHHAHDDLGSRCWAALEALIQACRAGRTGADLRLVWEATGEPTPPVPLAYGVGLGMEPPIIGAGMGDEVVLQAGTLLALQSWVARQGVGGYLARQVVFISEEGPQVLSHYEKGQT
jgi:Xaa-Pro dipeptidase